MRRCLADDVLVLAHYGDATEADRRHLATCLPCAARHQRLARDLATIGRALGRPAPRGRAGGGRKRLAVVLTVLGALVLLAAGEGWLWRASKSLTSPAVAFDVVTVAFLEDVDAVLSGASDVNVTVLGAGPGPLSPDGLEPAAGAGAANQAEP